MSQPCGSGANPRMIGTARIMRRSRTHLAGTIVTVVTVLTIAVFSSARAEGMFISWQGTVPCRPQDQIWLISTRRLPKTQFWSKRCCPTFRYYRFCPGSGWQLSCERQFLASRVPGATNTLYVHGNRRSPSEAMQNGLHVYCRLAARAPCRPIRHVIWSWPSGELPGRLAILRDVRVKYRRTTSQSYYLACWLARTERSGQLTLLGYSYGARTIIGALHLRAGGGFQGFCLPRQCHCRCPQYRVVLWAPATQCDWLCPSAPHGCALQCVASGLVLYNPCDPILCRFNRFIFSAHGPALGLTGMPCELAASSVISQVDASPIVGKSHSWCRYVDSECLMSCIRAHAICW